jgi:hypothetical protein
MESYIPDFIAFITFVVILVPGVSKPAICHEGRPSRARHVDHVEICVLLSDWLIESLKVVGGAELVSLINDIRKSFPSDIGTISYENDPELKFLI